MQNVYRLKQVRRWLMAVLSGLLLVGLLTVGGSVLAQDLPPNSAGVAVQSEVLQTLQEEGRADFILVMAEQADLSAAYQMDWETRGWYVYNTLKETAERSQAPVIAALEAAGVRYQSFIAGNEIYVYDGSRAVLNRALWAGEIQEVRAPVEISLAAPRFELIQPGPAPQNQIQATAWGLTDTHAPDFWAQFGLRGEGVRVPALIPVRSGITLPCGMLMPVRTTPLTLDAGLTRPASVAGACLATNISTARIRLARWWAAMIRPCRIGWVWRPARSGSPARAVLESIAATYT